MIRSVIVWVLVAALCVMASAVFYYKAFELSFPLTPDTTSNSWHVEVRMHIRGSGKPVSASLYLPRFSDGFSIVDENFISDGYGFETMTRKESKNRQANWTKRNVRGRDVIFYRAVIYETDNSASTGQQRVNSLRDAWGSKIFRDNVQAGEPFYMALENVIEPLRETSSGDLSFARQLLTWIEKNPRDDDLEVIRNESETGRLNAQQAAVNIMRYAGIGARLMHGIHLRDGQRDAAFAKRIEVYHKKSWRPLESNSEQMFLPWWVGDDPVFALEGARSERVKLSVRRHQEKALTEAIWRGDVASEKWYHLSVYDLPLDVQLLFSTLLMLPAGALVVAFARQVIGVSTFGTFMPILIAIAFRETQLLWGVTMFSLIIAFGLVVRLFLRRLHLLMVPRLTAVLTCVVMLLFFLSLAGNQAGIHAGLSVSLFPIVIIVMLIERINTTLEESGYRDALINSAGSIVVAVISYPVMTHPMAVHWVTTFPELLLLVLAAAIMLGRYNGYKLTEYWRFRHINPDV